MARAEQDELIVSHLPQAYGIALRIYRRIGMRLPLEDLQQYGCLGLCEAASKFDPGRGWKFNTFAEHRIRGAIIDGIRAETKARNQDEKERQPRQMVAIDLALYALPDERASHDYAALEARLDVDRLSAGLTKEQKSLVAKVYLAEEKIRVVAAKVNRHESGVSLILSAARKRMSAAA